MFSYKFTVNCGGDGYGRGAGPRMKRVGLNQHLSVRQVRHQQAVVVVIAPNVVKLQRVLRIGHDALVAEPFDDGLRFDFARLSGLIWCGSVRTFSKNGLLTSCVTIVTPSAAKARTPPE